MMSPIVMTHDDYNRLRALLDRMPAQDRHYFQDLRRELGRALRIASSDVPADVVTMGSTVHLRELETDEPWTFTVCFPEEADIREDRISVLSPVGTAIIGCRLGDVVDWPVPGGKVRIRIESIAYQPEAAGVVTQNLSPMEAGS
jgi:regulator of nucleoside diphosphate kinase